MQVWFWRKAATASAMPSDGLEKETFKSLSSSTWPNSWSRTEASSPGFARVAVDISQKMVSGMS